MMMESKEMSSCVTVICMFGDVDTDQIMYAEEPGVFRFAPKTHTLSRLFTSVAQTHGCGGGLSDGSVFC